METSKTIVKSQNNKNVIKKQHIQGKTEKRANTYGKQKYGKYRTNIEIIKIHTKM